MFHHRMSAKITHVSGHVVETDGDCFRSQHKAVLSLRQRIRGLLWAFPGGPSSFPSHEVRSYEDPTDESMLAAFKRELPYAGESE